MDFSVPSQAERTLNFNSGDRIGDVRCINVTVYDDTVTEGNEMFEIGSEIGQVQNILIQSAATSFLILDNDDKSVLQNYLSVDFDEFHLILEGQF